MKLPNSKSAIIDLRKLQDYCLNAEHPRGKHKARVFQRVLGVDRRDAEELRSHILTQVSEEKCIRGESDEYGTRFIVDIEWQRMGKSATIRTMWIIRRGQDTPRLTSCYVI